MKTKQETKKLIQEAGKCPKCGSEMLDYGNSNLHDECMSYDFTCDDCNTIGREFYNLVYVETGIILLGK